MKERGGELRVRQRKTALSYLCNHIAGYVCVCVCDFISSPSIRAWVLLEQHSALDDRLRNERIGLRLLLWGLRLVLGEGGGAQRK